jgi:hypothetical protein
VSQDKPRDGYVRVWRKGDWRWELPEEGMAMTTKERRIEQLEEALRRVLEHFQRLDSWPQTGVSVSVPGHPPLWVVGCVDDETYDTLKYIQTLLGLRPAPPVRAPRPAVGEQESAQ